MEKLPTEITEYILHRLQTEPALQAKRVCTTWRFLLRSKTYKVGLLFAESNYKEERNKLNYGDEYDPIRGKINYHYSPYDKLDKILNGEFILGYRYTADMLGSCNGLVCIEGAYEEKPFLICNPITGHVVYAPNPSKSITQDCNPSRVSGFGYCHSTNECKIIRLHYQGRMSQILVYNIGGVGGWRSKGSINIHPSYIAVAGCIFPGVYVNGSLHWLYLANILNTVYAIMAFDLQHEKFEFIDLFYFKNLRYEHGPKLLGGKNLYLVYSTFHNQPYCTDIWEFGVEWEDPFLKDSRFSVPEPLAVTWHDEFLLSYECRTLYCYDLKTSTLYKLFDGRAAGCSNINVIPHANSIVSIS